MRKKRNYTSYRALAKHPFSNIIFQEAMKISKDLKVVGTAFKVKCDLKRKPTEPEWYCLDAGTCLAYLLTMCQHLEQCVLYIPAFSPTPKMKKADISRHSHLLYSIENYIIRTQSVYDRILKLTDHIFYLYNYQNAITHELIVNNGHVKGTPMPSKLKSLRKILKEYYWDRNTIIHHEQYQEDELRRLEGYTILASKEPYKSDRYFKQEVRGLVSQIVKTKTKEFSETNKEICSAIAEAFDVLEKKYRAQKKALESLHGKIGSLAN